MAELRLEQIARRTRGRIIQGDRSLVFDRFNIDSRLTEPGELFFALTANRDGHDFVGDAAARGAQGAVTARDIPPPNPDFALVRVSDTAVALQELARSVLADHPVKVVGITGSIGKTTTKEFAASLLSQKFTVLKSEANYNNALGLALSLLKLTPRHEVAVLEMGMNAPDEIRRLTRIAQPDVSVITNVNPVHLEFLHSLEAIARAKREILEGTKPGGIAVLNADDSWIRKISQSWKGPRITFGLTPGCDVRASQVQKKGTRGIIFDLHLGGRTAEVHFPFLYEDYLYNLLAAVGVSHALELPFDAIARAIPGLEPFPRRGVLIQLPSSIHLIDDSYNSSPRALAVALKSLADLPARRKIAVLGDMLELGEKEAEFHARAGEQVVAYGWDVLVTVGPRGLRLARAARAAGMPPDCIFSFNSSGEAAARAVSLIQPGDLILVKGSRAMQMEIIVEKIKSRAGEN
ncbi:MAG: UDP-N-acetylmuramoyl-tripeptide--D-alanyl-D-alanine ligase [Candidatus Aminicenantes bacterium]|nr:UDP-N-acetylmuramoyl-tripeptide--D-alanyl-D-alanine ligase [Candidatus Aminicenantes bacterium]